MRCSSPRRGDQPPGYGLHKRSRQRLRRRGSCINGDRSARRSGCALQKTILSPSRSPKVRAPSRGMQSISQFDLPPWNKRSSGSDDGSHDYPNKAIQEVPGIRVKQPLDDAEGRCTQSKNVSGVPDRQTSSAPDNCKQKVSHAGSVPSTSWPHCRSIAERESR
jgi:hypothetical protein